MSESLPLHEAIFDRVCCEMEPSFYYFQIAVNPYRKNRKSILRKQNHSILQMNILMLIQFGFFKELERQTEA